MKRLLFLTAALLLVAGLAHAQSGTTAPTGQVQVVVAAEAGLTINTATANLTSPGTNFSPYIGTTGFTYFIRTSLSSGTGTITLKVTTDFSPTGGPSVASSGTTGDTLTYANTIAPPGTAESVQTASTGISTAVATFGANARSAKIGNSGSIAWTLINDPQYQTDTYTATITFTISAS
jgi:hypothetical protein